MEYVNVLELIKEDIKSFSESYDVCTAFSEEQSGGLLLKPRIILNLAAQEEENRKYVNLKVTLAAASGYDVFSREAAEIFAFISERFKSYYPHIISASLSSAESYGNGDFKKRILELSSYIIESTGTDINGTPCKIQSIEMIREFGSTEVFQMCDENPVGVKTEKRIDIGIMKNCSLKSEELTGGFDITYKGMHLKNCALIYSKGTDHIEEAKFYIGSIEQEG